MAFELSAADLAEHAAKQLAWKARSDRERRRRSRKWNRDVEQLESRRMLTATVAIGTTLPSAFATQVRTGASVANEIGAGA